jgi:hypothetical protein
MLDTPADPAREREEETACDRIFREFMAGYPHTPSTRVPLFSYPLFFCLAGNSVLEFGVQFAPRLIICLCERRVARFEELVDGGRQFLARFQQELGQLI